MNNPYKQRRLLLSAAVQNWKQRVALPSLTLNDLMEFVE